MILVEIPLFDFDLKTQVYAIRCSFSLTCSAEVGRRLGSLLSIRNEV
jgi:hypothetical protein